MYAEEPASVLKMQQHDQLTSSLNELYDESRIHSAKLQGSEGLKVRLKIERKKILLAISTYNEMM